MPREIIDTQTSRGRLLKRRITYAVLTAVVVLAVLVGIWLALHHGTLVGFQGNSAPRWNLALRDDAT